MTTHQIVRFLIVSVGRMLLVPIDAQFTSQRLGSRNVVVHQPVVHVNTGCEYSHVIQVCVCFHVQLVKDTGHEQINGELVRYAK